MIKKISICIVVCTVICLQGCGKKNNEPNTVPNGQATLMLHIHMNVGKEEILSYALPYPISDSQKVSFTTAQYYVSEAQLKTAEGNWIRVEGGPNLISPEKKVYEMGKIPAGRYSELAFMIGLPALLNRKSPDEFPTAHAMHTPSMWYGTPALGYAFLSIECLVMSPQKRRTFVVQTGGNLSRNASVSFPTFSVSDKNVEYVHLVMDCQKLISHLVSQPTDTIQPYSNEAEARIVADISTSLFSYEK